VREGEEEEEEEKNFLLFRNMAVSLRDTDGPNVEVMIDEEGTMDLLHHPNNSNQQKHQNKQV